MKKEEITFDMIKSLYVRKRYEFFSGNYNLNLFGIRSEKNETDLFDDYVGIAYNNTVFLISATVDPGLPWLLTPMNGVAAAAIAEGQYRSVWQMGWFKGTRSLIQVRKFRIYRDANRDKKFDYDPQTIVGSPYTDGIFLHQHFQWGETAYKVGPSSAGCVVPKSNNDYEKLFGILLMQIKEGFGDKFTFTLFNERELT